MLLDAVCSARDTLVVTYSGRDVRTGAQLPPGVPVGELLDALDAAHPGCASASSSSTRCSRRTRATSPRAPGPARRLQLRPQRPRGAPRVPPNRLRRNPSWPGAAAGPRGRPRPRPARAVLPAPARGSCASASTWPPRRARRNPPTRCPSSSTRSPSGRSATGRSPPGCAGPAPGTSSASRARRGVPAAGSARDGRAARGGSAGRPDRRRGRRVRRRRRRASPRSVDVELDLDVPGTGPVRLTGGVRGPSPCVPGAVATGDVAVTTIYSRVKAKQTVRAWIELLALSAATGDGRPCRRRRPRRAGQCRPPDARAGAGGRRARAPRRPPGAAGRRGCAPRCRCRSTPRWPTRRPRGPVVPPPPAARGDGRVDLGLVLPQGGRRRGERRVSGAAAAPVDVLLDWTPPAGWPPGRTDDVRRCGATVLGTPPRRLPDGRAVSGHRTFEVTGPLPTGTTSWRPARARARRGRSRVPSRVRGRGGRRGRRAARRDVRAGGDGRAARPRPRAPRQPRDALADPATAAASADAVVRHLAAPEADVAARRARCPRRWGFDAATVATIHEFCQQVLTSLGTAADVDPTATLVEDVDDLVEEVCDDLYVRFAVRPRRRTAPVLPGRRAAHRAGGGGRADARIEPRGAAPETPEDLRVRSPRASGARWPPASARAACWGSTTC